MEPRRRARAAVRSRPDRYLTVRYAGASGDFNPIHIDEAFARQVGLPGHDPARPLHDGPGRARADRRGAAARSRCAGSRVQFRGMGVPGGSEITVTGSGRDGRRTASRSSRRRSAAGRQGDHPQRRGRGRPSARTRPAQRRRVASVCSGCLRRLLPRDPEDPVAVRLEDRLLVGVVLPGRACARAR